MNAIQFTEEIAMNQDIFEGKWEALKGRVKQAWGKLTDDDLKAIEGNQQEIYGKLQTYYGYTKEKAEEEIRNFRRKNG